MNFLNPLMKDFNDILSMHLATCNIPLLLKNFELCPEWFIIHCSKSPFYEMIFCPEFLNSLIDDGIEISKS